MHTPFGPLTVSFVAAPREPHFLYRRTNSQPKKTERKKKYRSFSTQRTQRQCIGVLKTDENIRWDSASFFGGRRSVCPYAMNCPSAKLKACKRLLRRSVTTK